MNQLGFLALIVTAIALWWRGFTFQKLEAKITAIGFVGRLLVGVMLMLVILYRLELLKDGGYLLLVLFVIDWILESASFMVHEAGHVVFSLFGTFFHVLGGTLFQLLLPAAVAVFLYSRRLYFCVSVIIIWLGHGLFHTAWYIQDSHNSRVTPFKEMNHDWNYILGTVGLLDFDHYIGNVCYVVATLIMLSGILLLIFIPEPAPPGEEANLKDLLPKF